jgi:hypothetical protein
MILSVDDEVPPAALDRIRETESIHRMVSVVLNEEGK